MLARFWGVRGSLPTPTTANLKYGGDTPCLEVRTSQGQTIIFDSGTGIRPLGRKLLQETPPGGHRLMLFLTHYHWDHVQGLPFFEPMYVPSNIVYMHGFQTKDISVEKALGEQMANPFFPVDTSVMRATRDFYTIGEESLQVGAVQLTTRYLNHPQGCLGYRIEDAGRVLVYATDTEHGDPRGDRNVRELAQGADVLIYDAQYTPQEYPQKKGWGHSTWEEGIRIAKEAGVKNLILFHHDPDHDDYSIDTIVQEARRHFPSVYAAMREMEIELAPTSHDTAFRERLEKRYNTRHEVPLPLSVRLASGEKHTEVQNLSLDGLYFISDYPVEPGSIVEIEIKLIPPVAEKETIKAQAKVVRCERVGDKAGIGVTFR
jgi:phosphoribosyl 1,2-cyclic phosphodiesterase